MSRHDFRAAYATLCLPAGASADAVKVARRELLRAFNPERFGTRDPVRRAFMRERRVIDAAYGELLEMDPGVDAVPVPDPRVVANLRVEQFIHEYRLSRWRSQVATAIAALCMGVGLSFVFADGGYVRVVFFGLILAGGVRTMQVWRARNVARRGVERTTAALRQAMPNGE